MLFAWQIWNLIKKNMSRISEPSSYISENTFLMRSFRENNILNIDGQSVKEPLQDGLLREDD